MTPRTLRSVTASFLLGCLPAAARADVAELVQRVPPQANAVIAVDVAHLRTGGGAPAQVGAAPAGAAVPAGGAATPRSPVPLPRVAGVKSLVLAAHLNYKSGDPAWEVALMETEQKP